MNLKSRLMPYDLYERHAVTAQLLKLAIGTRKRDVRILDVGGRDRLLVRFLPYHVSTINIDGTGGIVGSGISLPLADRSFDSVVTIDTLEHLPAESRPAFLKECLRVARHSLVVAAPYGSQGHNECEKRLDAYYRSVHGESHPYLIQHIRYGLPGVKELDRIENILEPATVRRYFAGDYVWQGRCFRRALLAHRTSTLLARILNLYNQIVSLALFHRVRLQARPGPTSNRFYLLVKKEMRENN